MEYRLDTYKTLSEEVIKYSGIFDDMNIIRDSLSSKSGIPLYYIQIYLQNIKVIANDLLDVIYNGELALEDFDINADEFTMPYYTKGTLIKDVSHASQGEKSFISLAISFGLIYESISKYNILLLDEIDATLDTSNRMKFIQVLERWIDMIDAEQLFLISHNNMFSMYPVSVVSMNNSVTDENKNADLIKIKLS
jgi:DNA repair exonuclease SbcCD ATPase subunit